MQIDTSSMVAIATLAGSEEYAGHEAVRWALDAEGYLRRQRWCEDVLLGWLDRAWDGILGVYYFHVKPRLNSGADKDVWVIAGDVPPAYIDTRDCHTGMQALSAYVAAMSDWVKHVLSGQPTSEDIPVNVAPTKEHARMLESRLSFLVRHLLEDEETG